MSYLKYAIATLALTLFVTPSIASAQSLQTLGTRRGAIGGAILGAIIGDQNNEGLAGAAIGGLVGGAIGNVTGRNLDRRYSGGQSSYNYGGYGGASYNRPAPYKKVAPVPYKRVAPTYRPSPIVAAAEATAVQAAADAVTKPRSISRRGVTPHS